MKQILTAFEGLEPTLSDKEQLHLTNDKIFKWKNKERKKRVWKKRKLTVWKRRKDRGHYHRRRT